MKYSEFAEKLKEYTEEIKKEIKNGNSEAFTKIYEDRVNYILENVQGLYSEEMEKIIKKEDEVIKKYIQDDMRTLSEQILESRKEEYRRRSYAMYE